MSTIVYVLTLISCVAAIIATFIKKDFSVLQKVNALIYLFFTAISIYLLSPVIDELKSTFNADYPYVDILSNLFLLITLISTCIVTAIKFYKNEKFQKNSFHIYDFGIIVFAAIMAINILYSNKEFTFMLSPLIIYSVINLQMMVNASEDLKTTSSKVLYFVTNGSLAVFWVACLIMLLKKVPDISASVTIIIISSLILAFCGLTFGLININKLGAKKWKKLQL